MVEDAVLKRIQYFLDYNHWSIYRLAKESGLSYSSLNNIFNRKTCPGIPTLEKICQGFHISLSEFFEYGENPLRSNKLSDAEQSLLRAYKTLSASDKMLLNAYLDGLCKRQR